MTAEESCYIIDDNDAREFNRTLNSFISNKLVSREKLNEKLDAWKKGASEIKVTQATNFPKPYDDPQYQNIKYWDTPGYNGIKSISSAPDYLEDINTFISNLSIIPAGKKKEFEYILIY